MPKFYIQTEQHVVGPFSRVGMQEAAMARIIARDAVIGTSPEGPWRSATEIGLFDKSGQAMPHAKDVVVPKFHVQGMPAAFQGPFKLRELIGFVTHGMLPLDAMLASVRENVSESEIGLAEWKPITQLRVLKETLRGRLVLVDRNGKLILQSAPGAKSAEDARKEGARLPMELAPKVSRSDPTASVPTETEVDPEYEAEQALIAEAALEATERRESTKHKEDEETRRRSESEQKKSRPPEGINKLLAVPRRLVIPIAAALIVILAGGYFIMNSGRTQRHHVIGEWVAGAGSDSSGGARFAISFRDNGKCTIYNSRGRSWAGDFVWLDTFDDPGAENPFSPIMLAKVPQGHINNLIQESDGFLKFTGFGEQSPEIDGIPADSLVLRRSGDELMVGYLSNISFILSEGRIKRAGWILTSPNQSEEVKQQLMDLEASQ